MALASKIWPFPLSWTENATPKIINERSATHKWDESTYVMYGYFAKQHHQSFPSGRSSLWVKKSLDLVHTYVCSPTTASSLNNKYFVFFIDDYTRMTWVYFLLKRSEAFRIFKKFKTYVEKQSVTPYQLISTLPNLFIYWLIIPFLLIN